MDQDTQVFPSNIKKRNMWVALLPLTLESLTLRVAFTDLELGS